MVLVGTFLIMKYRTTQSGEQNLPTDNCGDRTNQTQSDRLTCRHRGTPNLQNTEVVSVPLNQLKTKKCFK